MAENENLEQTVDTSAPIENQPNEKSKQEKVEKVEKTEKTNKTKKKEKKKSKIATKLKETGSELKKVSWPSFATVVKQTGVVLAVVIICMLVLFGIDRLLSLLFDLFVQGLS